MSLAAAGCTSGTTASNATGTEQPPSSPTATSSPAAPASPVVPSAAAAGQDADWPTYDRTADRGGVSVSSSAPGTVRCTHSHWGSVPR
jgi:hypothetical protein